MRVVTAVFNLVLFLIALGFALSNTEVTELRFFLFGGDALWRAPLVIFLLLFFVAGAIVGLLAATPSLFRHKREISRMRKSLRSKALDREHSQESVRASVEVLPPDAASLPPRLGG